MKQYLSRLKKRKVKKNNRIILGVTGSIAAYKSADIIRLLMSRGFRVSVVMTKEAENFITPLTLSSLSREEVFCSLFFDSNVDKNMLHIDLAKEADLFLIVPATANIIGKIACGLADDLVSCIAMATKAPILIAPAMNTQMYENKIVQSNCKKLKEFGVRFIDPVVGNLACEMVGIGHIADNDKIVEEVLRVLKDK